MKWTRADKQALAAQILSYIEQGLKPRQIAQAVGKSKERIRQIRKLFGLPDWRRSGPIDGGKVSPQ